MGLQRDRVVVVTGASRGAGKGIALALGATGATVYVTGRTRHEGDAALPLVASVHYAKEYDNAFWDGDQMVFGDGDGVIFQRFTASLDVIGHELAHGVTQSTSGLAYRDQPGALNEHISDVFGVLVKQRSLGQAAADADWLIGAELLAPGVQGRAVRALPSRRARAVRHHRPCRTC